MQWGVHGAEHGHFLIWQSLYSRLYTEGVEGTVFATPLKEQEPAGWYLKKWVLLGEGGGGGSRGARHVVVPSFSIWKS